MLYNQPATSHSPSSPARCTTLARNHPNTGKFYGVVAYIGKSRVHMSNWTHDQMAAHTDMQHQNFRHTHTKMFTKTKQTQLSNVTAWHKVCFSPTALLAYSLTTHSFSLCPSHSSEHPDHSQKHHELAGEYLFTEHFPQQAKLFSLQNT